MNSTHVDSFKQLAMADADRHARQLLTEAEKKLSRPGFFQSFFTSTRDRTDEAIECYEKAGALFKLSKNWLQASAAFKTAATLHLDADNRLEAAHDYVQAAKCLEKHDSNSAVKYLLSAATLYLNINRFTMAAKLHTNVAEIYEQNSNTLKAVQHYEQAADFFKVEESHTSAKRCLLKIAHYASLEFQDYEKAIGLYEEVAFEELKTPVLYFNAKESFVKAVLCHLCVDVASAKYALERYVERCRSLMDSREYKFLKNLTRFVEYCDVDGFTTTVREYDEVSKLDTWYTKILLTIKKQITQPSLL